MTKKKKKRRGGTVLMIIGILLILAAGGVILNNHLQDQKAEKFSEQGVSELEEIIAEAGNRSSGDRETSEAETETESADPAESGTDDEEETGEDGVPAMPEAELQDGYTYVGILEIPAWGYTFPVMSTLTDETMKIGPGRYYGSVYTDNMVIAAHNYPSQFGQLNGGLAVGSEIIFTDLDGITYRYVVREFETMHRSEGYRMCEGDWDLSLFTCVPWTYNRIAARCVKVSEE